MKRPKYIKVYGLTGTKRHIFPQIVSLLPDLNLPPRGSIKAKGSNSDQFFIDCLMLTLVSQCSEDTIKFFIKLWKSTLPELSFLIYVRTDHIHTLRIPSYIHPLKLLPSP